MLLASAPATADSGYAPVVRLDRYHPDLQWNGWRGEYRFAYHHAGDFTLDESGTPNPLTGWGEHRLRLSPSLTWGVVGMVAELDIVGGQLFGDHEDLFPDFRRLDRRLDNDGLNLNRFLLRQLYAQLLVPIGLFRTGQMTSAYGLGLIANTGEDDESRFGVRRYGDLVSRALMLLKPFRPLTGGNRWGDYLSFLASGDLVLRDENAIFADGDVAWQLNGGFFWRHPDFTNGAVFTRRTQEDSDGDSLEARVININGRNRLALTTMAGRGEEAGKEVPDLSLALDYELVWLFGHTDRFIQFGSEEGLDLAGFGGVGRLTFTAARIGLEAELEGGYASGDHNSYDDTSHAFFFDPDYKVGLVFFDLMLPLISARAAELSGDPANLAVPPKGLDLIPSQGRVTNTYYLLPQLRYSFTPDNHLLEKVQLLTGILFLATPADFAHSYYTFRNGGTAANHLGRAVDSNYLGTELLAGLRARIWPWRDHLGLTLRADQSWFLPGAALAWPDGSRPDPVWKTMATVAVEWR